MATRIELGRLQELLGQNAQLVEVLPSQEYDEEHIPGALNIPLKRLDAETTAVLRKHDPVIVYCFDYL